MRSTLSDIDDSAAARGSKPAGEHDGGLGSRLARRLWRPRVLIAGSLALVLAIAIGVALSWHFSSEVVVPDHAPWPPNASVISITSTTITFARSEGTMREGTYGLDWQAGHAIAGNVIARSPRSVTRQLRSLQGYLTAGMRVAIDPDVYAGNPRESVGLPFRAVRFPDEVGPMPAWLIPGHTNTWAIVVHGINGYPQEGLRIAPTLHQAGLSALLISYRSDLGAPASPDGLHHMGLTEWRDLQAAVRFALAHGARRVVLVGYSMGGAIVAQFMERSPLASRVAGVVLDAPALSWKAILSFNASQMGLPSFLSIPVEWMIDARIGPDWGSLDALGHPQDFHVPILLFHGTQDKLVPISTSDAFARELRQWVTYYRVPEAGHTEAWNVDPALYDTRLAAFLARLR